MLDVESGDPLLCVEKVHGFLAVVQGCSPQVILGIKGLEDGSLVVADKVANKLILIDPLDGTQSILSQGQFFESVSDVALSPDGNLYVADTGGGGLERIIAVDPDTGAQSLVLVGGNLENPAGIGVVPVPEPLASRLGLAAIAVILLLRWLGAASPPKRALGSSR